MIYVYERLAAFRRSRWGDIVWLGLLAVLVVLVSWLSRPRGTGWSPVLLGGWAILLAGIGVLWWRRSHPVLVLVGTTAVALTYYLLGYPPGPEPLPFVVALYAAAGHGPRKVSWTTVALVPVVVGSVEIIRNEPRENLALVMAVLALVVVSGELARARRASVQALEDRALAAERTREQEAARQVAEERLRIARELHDVLAHHLSVISIQAGAAAVRGRERPEVVDDALRTIRASASEALTEVRSALGVLRAEPAPTLAGLADLLARTRAAGPAVELTVDGELTDLPATVQSAAYRIVQEALTNVVRHSGATAARVRLCRQPTCLIVEIGDDGRGTADAARDGYGLRTMRERAAALGGDLDVDTAGPRGVRVSARLPMTGQA
ncbi:sensor histidine kinase [Pseudonocardia xinjiangensis]|uniref:sensor histidine kinase n=1 Tax=Pseudonocardia xinjiangensis TaxID=75289 RepID=UPI003D91B430